MGAKRKKSVFKTAEIVALAAILAAILFIVAQLAGQMKETGRNDYSYIRPDYAKVTDAPDEFAHEPAKEKNEKAEIPLATATCDTRETLKVIMDTPTTETENSRAEDLPITIETEETVRVMSETDTPSGNEFEVEEIPEAQFADGVPIMEVHFLDVDRNDANRVRCEDECAFIDSGAAGNLRAEDLPITTETEETVRVMSETDTSSGNECEVEEIPEAQFADGVPILEVHFLDVDRNDAIMVRCGDECAFIDSGAKEYGPRCVEYMRERGIDHLKYYIGTHAHADHVGGAGAILAAIETDVVLINYDLTIRCMKDIATLPEQDEALDNATYQTVSVGDEFTLGGAKLTCIGPVNLKPLTRWHDEKENTNSLVFRLEYGDISFLLTADADTPSFYQILKNDPDELKCTVFKNPHHNGKAGELVVKALEAEYIVIQTSRDHPPVNDYVKALRKKGICPLIVSKDNAGTTAFFTDGQTLRYTTENQMGDWSLSRTELTLKKGEKKGVARNMVPKNMIDTLMWTTSDAAVAYPDPNFGTVNAVGIGECVITATAFDGTTRSIAVTVE